MCAVLSLQDVGRAIETPGVAPVCLLALSLLAAPLPCPSPSAGTLGLGSGGRVALSPQSVDTVFLVYKAGPATPGPDVPVCPWGWASQAKLAPDAGQGGPCSCSLLPLPPPLTQLSSTSCVHCVQGPTEPRCGVKTPSSESSHRYRETDDWLFPDGAASCPRCAARDGGGHGWAIWGGRHEPG